MLSKTDLRHVKKVAQAFLMLEPELTAYSQIVVKHPFTDSGTCAINTGSGEWELANILDDPKAMQSWRETMSDLINDAESAGQIHMMLTKSYRFAFLKYAMPHLSKQDFSEYLADAWVNCEAPNGDPNFTQRQMVSLFRKAAPESLMDEDDLACASGMSWLALDTKGDLARNYGAVAKDYYGYNVAVIDLRNPTRSDGNNLLSLVNRYMDIARKNPDNISARAKAEKYAKILAKTIVNPDGDASNYGQNAFFYDAAEGLLCAVVLLLAEYLPPTPDDPQERRHIISVFKLVQDLLAPSTKWGKSQFQVLMDLLPPTHKARWFAGTALNSAEQAMASVMSTVLSRLNAFLDSELEQVLCFDSAIDAEKFAAEKSAIFLILPEEDSTKNFMAGLMIQNLSRELFAVADENGGKLKNRVVLFCDELGTMPPFDILPLFSAGRSRRLTLVPIIQSLAQLEKNYGKEGAEIIADNCQDTIFGGFAPNSQTAEVLSKALGSRTVMSGSISRGKNDPSQSLQMVERALLSPDELKSIPKGNFIVMKTGTHPMRTRLRLFLDWGITFDSAYTLPERAARKVAYADKGELERSIMRQTNCVTLADRTEPPDEYNRGGMAQAQMLDEQDADRRSKPYRTPMRGGHRS